MLHFFSHIMTKRKNLPFNYSKISVLNEHMDGRRIPLLHLLAILGTTVYCTWPQHLKAGH